MTKLERSVTFNAGYDCWKFKCKFGSDRCIPGAGGSHGIHGLEIRFLVKGEHGAVQFLIFTGWLPQYAEHDLGYVNVRSWCKSEVMPADLGYHSKKPMYEGHKPMECKILDGEPCYYDGSGLQAADAMYALVNAGDEGLWTFLEGYYDCVFLGKPYPMPAEYRTKLRGSDVS